MTGYFSEIWRLRYFWMALVRIDLRKRYRRSVIGIGWSLLRPIAMTAVLCAVFAQILGSKDIRQYAPYLLTGLTFWAFFCGVVTQGCQCFIQGESYIRQQPTPLAIYPLRATLGAGFHFLLGLAIALTFVWWVNGFGNLPALLSLLPTLLLLFVIGWSVAVCVGIVNVLFQDSQHLIDVALQILFYVTPIMYRPEQLQQGRRLTQFIHMNPLSSLMDLIRDPILYGQFPSLASIGIACLTGLVTVSLASLALLRFEKRMIFYL